MELVDLSNFGNLFRIVAVMRQRMMRIRNANLRVGSCACLARSWKVMTRVMSPCKAKSWRSNINRGMIRVGRWNTNRSIEIWQRIVERIGFGLLDATFDFTNRIEVFGNSISITGSQSIL